MVHLIIEYLVILAVIVVFGLMIYGIVGGFGATTVTRSQSESYWKTQDIAIQPNYRVSPGLAELTIQNRRPFDVEVTSITFEGIGKMKPSAVSLSAGETADINITEIPQCFKDSTYSYNIVIKYKESKGREFTVTGGYENPLVGFCEE